jgi:two-component system OmpR family sensor kinase
VIRNAVRYTRPQTRVTIEAEADRDSGKFVIRVCDQGPGVDSAELGQIFEPFVRVGESTGGGRGGYGLGLAIAKRAVNAHGGEVEASNREGGGLCISLRLPLADQESAD